MRYPYRCTSKECQFEFDVIKSIREIDNTEHCDKCGSEAARFISRTHFYGASVEDAEYSPAFGCIVKSRKHRQELARRHGVEEIGNEDPNKIHDHFEKQRDKALEDSWDKV